MTTNSNLTLTKRIAIEGEVAQILMSSSHNADILYNFYLALKSMESKDESESIENLEEREEAFKERDEVDEEYKQEFFKAFIRATEFPDEIYKKLQMELGVDKYPMYLWENKFVEDLKEAIKILKSTYSNRGNKVSYDINVVTKAIIRSAFTEFCMKHSLEFPSAYISLCNAILKDSKLDFLHNICFFVITELQSYIEEHGDTEDNIALERKTFLYQFRPDKLMSFENEKAIAEGRDPIELPDEMNGQVKLESNTNGRGLLSFSLDPTDGHWRLGRGIKRLNSLNKGTPDEDTSFSEDEFTNLLDMLSSKSKYNEETGEYEEPDKTEEDTEDTEVSDEDTELFAKFLSIVHGATVDGQSILQYFREGKEEAKELENKRAELADKVNSILSTPSTNGVYVVKKIFKGSKASTSIREFTNLKEAQEFIQKIKEQFPDLQNTCDFEIEERLI